MVKVKHQGMEEEKLNPFLRFLLAFDLLGPLLSSTFPSQQVREGGSRCAHTCTRTHRNRLLFTSPNLIPREKPMQQRLSTPNFLTCILPSPG